MSISSVENSLSGITYSSRPIPSYVNKRDAFVQHVKRVSNQTNSFTRTTYSRGINSLQPGLPLTTANAPGQSTVSELSQMPGKFDEKTNVTLPRLPLTRDKALRQSTVPRWSQTPGKFDEKTHVTLPRVSIMADEALHQSIVSLWKQIQGKTDAEMNSTVLGVPSMAEKAPPESAVSEQSRALATDKVVGLEQKPPARADKVLVKLAYVRNEDQQSDQLNALTTTSKKSVSFDSVIQRMYIEGNDGDADSISSLNSLSDG
ncbi:hypothetical protein ABW286_17880 [Erwinia papayae]|uniref:Uncharacterized protein n=1 Tax=Erwinia papayae TaxID=206499 RepID=A0ABV3N5D0_9GAMM